MKKTLLFIILLTQILYTQDDDLKLGKTLQQNSASVFDLSDPKGVNIEVNLWGFVNYPGRYIIPYNSTLVDVLSFSGGHNRILKYRGNTDFETCKRLTEYKKYGYQD